MELNQIREARLIHLKDLRNLANKVLNDNLLAKGKVNSKWEYSVIENNIHQLKIIINSLNKYIETSSSIKYVKAFFEEGQDNYYRYILYQVYEMSIYDEITEYTISNHTLSHSVYYDLYWFDTLKEEELSSIAFGKETPDVLDRYCPVEIQRINNKVLPYLKTKEKYSLTADILQNVLNNFNHNSFVESNILLITITENLVRELCKFVYHKQNPAKNKDEIEFYIYHNFNSLESLILKGDWKNDILTSAFYAYNINKYVNDSSLHDALKKLNDKTKEKERLLKKLINILNTDGGLKAIEENDIKRKDYLATINSLSLISLELIRLRKEDMHISLPIKLQFLLRRYKEDRNSIIHGNYYEFNKGWKSYIYLSAIYKVFDLIEYYEKLYTMYKSI